jgi:hypothetical protein
MSFLLKMSDGRYEIIASHASCNLRKAREKLLNVAVSASQWRLFTLGFIGPVARFLYLFSFVNIAAISYSKQP